MSYNRYNSSFIRILALAAVSLAFAACKEQQEKAAAPRPVKTVTIAQSSGRRLTTYSGVVRPRIETALGFRISGKIVERLVNTGDQASKNQVIARLDAVDLKLSQQSALANVAAAQTRLSVARDSLQRAKKLYPKGFIAKAAVDQRQLEADAARSALNAAESQARQAANATGYAELKSDKEGVVTAVLAEPGQVVAAGTPVVKLAQLGDIEAAVSIPEQDVVRLTVGQPVTIGLWAAPGLETKGRIREISAAADAASRTYAIRVTIDSPPPVMRLGMTVTATIAYSESRPSIIAPLAALTGKGRDMAVFVVDAASATVSRRPVAVSGIEDGAARIASGLRPGEIIVAAGVQFLSDGQKVRLTGDKLNTAAIERQARP
jgi:multidrug efflux system membrane fusion protein